MLENDFPWKRKDQSMALLEVNYHKTELGFQIFERPAHERVVTFTSLYSRCQKKDHWEGVRFGLSLKNEGGIITAV